MPLEDQLAKVKAPAAEGAVIPGAHMEQPDKSAKAAKPQLELTASRQFSSWLREQQLSLAFTTYQSGKLFLIGMRENGRLSVFERTFNRSMGLWGDAQTLYLTTLYQLWRFENTLDDGQRHDGYDRLYVPRLAWTTGHLDAHDVAVDGSGRVVFVNTLFSCLATVSERHSFVPLWQPPFVTRLAAEDRCHLNGLAMENGAPAYVTAVAKGDAHEAWRDHRRDGGVVIDVRTNQIVLEGLSMPHSPRVHRGKLWLLDSGNGQFGYVDLKRGKFESVAFCPGYARGLAFVGDFAVVGLSKPRENKVFSGLPLDARLREKNIEPRCQVQVIDLKRGDVVHSLRMEGVVTELYDVIVLPGVRRPTALGFKTEEIQRVISIGPAA
jgi:uncharacterized protein (TIGR03032 family)